MTRPTRQRERARESEGEDVDQDEAAACPECSSEDILKDADRGELVCIVWVVGAPTRDFSWRSE